MSFTNALIRALDIYSFIILIYVIISWIPDLKRNSFFYYISKIVDPYLDIFRKLNLRYGAIDFTPLLALIVLQIIKRIIFNLA